ncbi:MULTISPECIES: hypothetical protein [unclassified Streptomyces]|uniref:hypothetical protein n=1 Tax=unclassified Streptomyces TaxID=2593676 RepID=UPI00131E8C2D|nr:hypothetical protein [Streptomyces sp. NRRL F-2747]
MEWTVLISTVAGGAIATVSGGLLERWRWKRQRVDQSSENRRVLYGSYLALLSKTRHKCGSLARATSMPPAERSQGVWDTFEHCIGPRYEVEITAPPRVVTAATNTHRALADLCDGIAQGVAHGSDEYDRLSHAYREVHKVLRSAMRSDLDAAA